MKKLLAMVLVLVFALSLTASAEFTYGNYTHPTQGYSIVYPQEWLLMDNETIVSLINNPSMAQEFSHIDFGAYIQQIQSSDMAMFMNENGDNFNVTSVYIGAPFTADQLVEYLMPDLVEQFKSIMPSIEMLVSGDTAVFGDTEFAYVLYTYEGMIGAQYCICESGTLYYLTLTCNQINDTLEYLKVQKMFEKVLESFKE